MRKKDERMKRRRTEMNKQRREVEGVLHHKQLSSRRIHLGRETLHCSTVFILLL